MIFRQALEHVEQEGRRVKSQLQELKQSGWNSFEMKCSELLRNIESIRDTIEQSYTTITKHDLEQLTRFQVISFEHLLKRINFQCYSGH